MKDISTRAPEHLDKEEVKEKTAKILPELSELQNLLYAESKHSLLVVIQGMDASGKDGAVRNVFGTLNPQGVTVTSFKIPTAEELAHDFLWRIHKHSPAHGMIGIFNRSHYEDVLVTRVHGLCDDNTARKRMKAINHFEELLHVHNRTEILKFYLHVSLDEQHKRLRERIKDPTKQWKYNESDIKESKFWDEYMTMYEDCFEHCNDFPWIITPSDQNWYKEYMIAKKVRDTLQDLSMNFPGLKKQPPYPSA